MLHQNETRHGNCSNLDLRYPLFTATYSVVLALGLPLNTVALWTFVHRLGLQTVPVIYMANLAMSDLLFTLSLPMRIIYFATARWSFGDMACRIPGTLFSVNLYSSSFFITLISVDRLLALVYPLRSRTLRKPFAAWIACILVWISITVLSVPVAMNHGVSWDELCQVHRCFEHYSTKAWAMGFSILCVVTAVGIAIPFLIILGSTVVVIRTLWRKNMLFNMVDKHRVILMFVFNLLIYTVCFIPFHVAFILYGLQKLKLAFDDKDFFTVQTVTLCLASTNSCLDPIIYYFTTKHIQRKANTELTTNTTAFQVAGAQRRSESVDKKLNEPCIGNEDWKSGTSPPKGFKERL